MRRLLIAIGLVLALALGFVVWAGSGSGAVGKRALVAEALPIEPAPKAATSTITVVSWNIAWAFGWGSEYRQNAPQKSQADLDRALDRMAAELTRVGADVAILQEVDLGAHRSFSVDQARTLAERAKLPYVASVVSWDLNYLPFPYWPPSKHSGRMRSGGAILSRWPLEDCWAELLEKPKEQPFWYRAFYLFRYVEGCTVKRPGGALEVWNTHLEAFSNANREAQAEKIRAELEEKANPALIFGGDLNSVPPEAPLRKGFPDEPDTDQSNDRTVEIFRAVKGLTPAVTPEALKADASRFFSFPSHAPNRQLDHLFVGSGFEVLEAFVDREAGDPSDHLPLVVRLKFGG